ncbi:hypothetical protein CA830_41965, partial [Burkholderia multivorans]
MRVGAAAASSTRQWIRAGQARHLLRSRAMRPARTSVRTGLHTGAPFDVRGHRVPVARSPARPRRADARFAARAT